VIRDRIGRWSTTLEILVASPTVAASKAFMWVFERDLAIRVC
jgi:hypothetical protein